MNMHRNKENIPDSRYVPLVNGQVCLTDKQIEDFSKNYGKTRLSEEEKKTLYRVVGGWSSCLPDKAYCPEWGNIFVFPQGKSGGPR